MIGRVLQAAKLYLLLLRGNCHVISTLASVSRKSNQSCDFMHDYSNRTRLQTACPILSSISNPVWIELLLRQGITQGASLALCHLLFSKKTHSVKSYRTFHIDLIDLLWMFLPFYASSVYYNVLMNYRKGFHLAI